MKHIHALILCLCLVACGQDSRTEQTDAASEEAITAQPAASDPAAIAAAAPAELVVNEQTPFKVLSITEGIYDNTSALQINFNLPLKPDQDWSHLIRVRSQGAPVDSHWIFSNNRMALYDPFIEADTEYVVEVGQSLVSANGKILSQATKKTIQTQSQKKSARFLSQGNTLLKTDRHLPIEAVNVDAVEVKFWRIKPEQLHVFLQHPNKRDIYSLKQLNRMADLVYTSHYDLDQTKNKLENHNLPIGDIEAIKPAGTYFVTLMPDDLYDYEFASTWFMQTDIGLHTRVYRQSVAVFAHRLPAADSYADVQITVYDNQGKALNAGVTDAQGFVKLDVSKPHKMHYLLASHGDNSNLIRLHQPKLDLSEFKLSHRHYQPQELFLYAPRDLFRPGETVNINGLLRDADGQLVTASPVRVKISRPDSRVFKEFSWLGDDLSFYQTEFDLPNDAMTGQWSFQAKLANDQTFNYPFAVEDFLPERLKLDLSVGNDSAHVPLAEQPVIHIQSDYLYGAPAAGNRYDATVSVKATTRLFDDHEDFHFGSNHDTQYETNFTTDAATLSDSGSAALALPKRWHSTQFPLQVSSHVNVYESGGRPIARSINQYIWPQELVIGIKPMWDGRFASPNQVNSIELLAVDRTGAAIEVPHAEVLLIQENRERYWHWGDDGWNYRNSSQEVPVFHAVTHIEASGSNVLTLPLDYGSYRVEVRTQDQTLISSYRFFSGWRWYDPYAASGEKPDQVKLAWQADDLSAGTPATLTITAPYVGTALVTVESDEILWHQTITMDQAQQEIQIPIDASWQRHDLHASVMVIKAGESLGARDHLPKRALGVIHLPLHRADRNLQVELIHPATSLPDEPLTVTVKTQHADPNQTTYVTLAAVDTGVLNVSNFVTPKPFEWFFAERRYFPALRDVYGALIEMIDANTARQKFGGDADIARGGDEAQADVQIVSLLTEKVAFDANGEAEITLPIPYFNGELRLMAMAFNAHQYSGADSRIKIKAPIVVETSMPRFLAKGDATHATLEVHNTEDGPTELTLAVKVDAELGGETAQFQWSLAGDEKKVVPIPLMGQAHRGLGRIQVSAQSAAGFALERSWQLGLRPAMPAVTDQYKTTLKLGESLELDDSHYGKFDAANLKAVLQVSDTPVLNRAEHLQQLLQYPYGCLEQTSSRAWPLLLADESDFGPQTGVSKTELYDQRHTIINQAISRLLGMQLYSGGFGLWSENNPEEYWLTVFVTDFLVRAKKLGYEVPEQPLNQAITRLQNYLRQPASIDSNLAQYLSHRNHFEISYKAYAAYVLAEMKQVGLQDLRRLYDDFADQAQSPLPLAHLARGLELMGDNRRAETAWLQVVDFKWQRNRYDYYGDYGSKIRDYAEVIALGAQSPLMNQMSQSTLDLITPLQEDVANRSWLSTQERSALFKTSKQLKQANAIGSEWQIALIRGEQTGAVKQAQDFTRVWRGLDTKTDVTIENTGDKPVFLDVKYHGYLQQHRTENNGMVVRKKYFDLNGNHVDLRQIKSGDVLLVHVEMSLEEAYNYLPDALLVDLLPAGLELENQNLEHALKLDDIKVDGKYVRDWGQYTRIKHSEFRDDRFVAALTLSSYQNAHVFYLARAVTPGTYVIPPALIEDMYRPEIRATSDDLGQLVVDPVKP
ncbi:alpha-2-macroglobulin family protein [Marinicella meishanensis]|uniref:alpha-2-macroglobulin family protein n=1 Tax=Marinicella meishanensis TaxID=2873263 RepID=UPI001CBBC7B6|nr:alpha-2-macroglobulin [Marinicella sp. NBU2979]